MPFVGMAYFIIFDVSVIQVANIMRFHPFYINAVTLILKYWLCTCPAAYCSFCGFFARCKSNNNKRNSYYSFHYIVQFSVNISVSETNCSNLSINILIFLKKYTIMPKKVCFTLYVPGAGILFLKYRYATRRRGYMCALW
jgi:hypothetical protein